MKREDRLNFIVDPIEVERSLGTLSRVVLLIFFDVFHGKGGGQATFS